mgnify:CR=1 FL=1
MVVKPLLQLLQLRLERGAHLTNAARVRFAQALQLQRERVGQRLLQQRQLLGKRVDLLVVHFGDLAGRLDESQEFATTSRCRLGRCGRRRRQRSG